MLAVLLFTVGTTACVQSPAETSSGAIPAQPPGCLITGDGSLQAEVRGALVADLSWQNAQMQCEGGQRPDGNGIRVAIAGPLPAAATVSGSTATPPSQLRFIFGIDLHDTASGVAQALPTNLTVIVEGDQQLYTTHGDDKCAVETLQRTSLPETNGKVDRVKVRGYCIGPASDLAGTSRVLVPTFSFTALVRNGDDP
jgi:hypothetical protein